jgi:hypothetical protein
VRKLHRGSVGQPTTTAACLKRKSARAFLPVNIWTRLRGFDVLKNGPVALSPILALATLGLFSTQVNSRRAAGCHDVSINAQPVFCRSALAKLRTRQSAKEYACTPSCAGALYSRPSVNISRMLHSVLPVANRRCARRPSSSRNVPVKNQYATRTADSELWVETFIATGRDQDATPHFRSLETEAAAHSQLRATH